jgi:platelet-activating factor acetylhydrolase IB subunit alpha
MVLTDRQRNDLHLGIYEYLKSREGDAFQQAAAAFAQADPAVVQPNAKPLAASGSTLLEKKWTAIPRLQKKVLELERAAAHNVKIHAHRVGDGGGSGAAGTRRMLPRFPAAHTLQGHSEVVLTVQVHPVFTVVVSGSEDGTIKVSLSLVILWSRAGNDLVRELTKRTLLLSAAFFRSGITKVANTYVH